MIYLNFNLGNIDWKSQTFIVVLLAALNQLSTSIVTNVVTVVLPEISMDLNINVSTLNWITIIFFMASISISIPLSKIISQYGVKKYTKIAIVSLIVGLLISAFAIHTNMFLLSRIIQGASCAVLYFSVYMMIVLEMPEEKTGRVLGIVGSSGYVGMTIAPSIAGFISYYTSWRVAFLIVVPLLIFQLFLAHYITDEWTTEKRPIDNVGSLLYVLIIVFLVYGLSTIVTKGFTYLIIFAVILIIYILYERKREFPIYNLRLLRSFKYVVGNYSSMVGYFVTFIAAYVLSMHLQIVMGVDSRTTGMLLLITPILMVIVSPYAGRLSDGHDPRVISSIAMGIICCALIIFVFLKGLPLYWIVIGIALQGIGHGLFSSPNNRFVLTSVDVKDLPDASSFLSSIKEIGKLLCTSIFNVICVVYVGNMEVTENVSGLIHSSQLMMILCLFIGLSSIILMILSLKFFEREENPEVIGVFKKYLPERVLKWFKKPDFL